MTSFIGSPRP